MLDTGRIQNVSEAIKSSPPDPNSITERLQGLGGGLHRDGVPIPGLYASGNTTAHTEYGAGYQAGMTLAGGMVFSYRAVREMAAN